MLRDRHPAVVIAIGFALVVTFAIIAVAIGHATAPTEALASLGTGLVPGADRTSATDAIVWNIRLPRIVTAAGAGAALGLAGVVLRGLFRNPVADPQLVGLSATGSVGVLIGLWSGWLALGGVAGVIGGIIAGAVGSMAVYAIARHTSGDPSRFILAGVGFGFSVAAIVATASIAIHDPRIPDPAFWFVGGLGAATWPTAWWVVAAAIVATLVVVRFHARLDVMSLGPQAARHLGVDVAVVTGVCLGTIGAAVGASVGAAGVIAFVGLVAADLARAVAGEHHRRTLIAGAFLGAMLLIAADAISRQVGGRFEVPVGLVTAALGGPYLVWRITTRRSTP